MKKKHKQAVFIDRNRKSLGLTNSVNSFANQAFKKISSVKKAPIITILVFGSLLVLFAFSIDSTDKISRHKEFKLDIPSNPLISLTDQTFIDEIKWKNVEVQKGQSLSNIFDSLNLSQSLLYKIIHFDKSTKQLTKIYPGAVISFDISDQGEFKKLKYNISEQQELIVSLEDSEISTSTIEHDVEIQVQTSNGVITNSLFNAGKNAGLTDSMVMKLANIFAWDIDFVLDIREGDSFSLIYEKIYQDGEFLRDGKIIAASFSNQGDVYKAVAFDDGEGYSYYNPEGRNMKKAFLRAPLNFSYISSNFNPKRFHPVQKRVKPHRGIDYAAPVGTPVYAAGDGSVIRSSYDKFNGNHVFIQHPNGITTKYLHFTKRNVKQGQRVKQGQVIGTVGATGLVSGAHLHYEFVLNGVHRNPRTVELPKASPLAKNKMPEYLKFATPLFSQLESLDVNQIALQDEKVTKKES